MKPGDESPGYGADGSEMHVVVGGVGGFGEEGEFGGGGGGDEREEGAEGEEGVGKFHDWGWGGDWMLDAG